VPRGGAYPGKPRQGAGQDRNPSEGGGAAAGSAGCCAGGSGNWKRWALAALLLLLAVAGTVIGVLAGDAPTAVRVRHSSTTCRVYNVFCACLWVDGRKCQLKRHRRTFPALSVLNVCCTHQGRPCAELIMWFSGTHVLVLAVSLIMQRGGGRLLHPARAQAAAQPSPCQGPAPC
jgi:hypothetical protein